jgi:uncharacterized protein (DUF983 family)
MYKDSRLYSILNNRCPHCHEGRFFETDHAYDLKRFAAMNRSCSACGESFRREPGYYFGATYVSYALTVGFGIVLFLALCGIAGISVYAFFGIFTALLVTLLPIFFRVSRLIWINLFVPYRKPANR